MFDLRMFGCCFIWEERWLMVFVLQLWEKIFLRMIVFGSIYIYKHYGQ